MNGVTNIENMIGTQLMQNMYHSFSSVFVTWSKRWSTTRYMMLIYYRISKVIEGKIQDNVAYQEHEKHHHSAGKKENNVDYAQSGSVA